MKAQYYTYKNYSNGDIKQKLNINTISKCSANGISRSGDKFGIKIILIDEKGIEDYFRYLPEIKHPVITICNKALCDFSPDSKPLCSILDSSIWFRYLPFSKINDDLQKLIDELTGYKQIYPTDDAINFQKHYHNLIKLNFDSEYGFKNLINLPSETEAFSRTQKKFNALQTLFRANTKAPLATCLIIGKKGKNREACGVTELLKSTEKRLNGKANTDYRLESLELTRKENFNCVEDHLKSNNVDVILLDYNMEVDDLAIEVLKKLNENATNLNTGTNDLFWILPITINPSSLFSHMQQQYLPIVNKNWYLSRGTDPINMPNFFAYKLVNMLCVMTEEAGFIDVKEQYKYDILSILKELFKQNKKENSNDEDILNSNDNKGLEKDCLNGSNPVL